MMVEMNLLELPFSHDAGNIEMIGDDGGWEWRGTSRKDDMYVLEKRKHSIVDVFDDFINKESKFPFTK